MTRPVITDKPIIDQAEFNGVTIWRKEGGSIEVSDTNYPSMKAALMDIAQKAGIEVESGWNTQYLGWYIIQQLKKSGSPQQTPTARAERDGEVVIELKEAGTLLPYMLENSVDMSSIKCLTLKGKLNKYDVRFISVICQSFNILETLDLSDVQMETVGWFKQCSFKEVLLPKCAVTIETDAFRDCESLMRVIIPDSVTSIGRWAFEWCESLTQVTIPDSVTSIELEAFSRSSLKRVEIKSKTPFELESALDCCPDDLKIVVPKGTLQLFKASWSQYSEKIVESEE